MRSRRISLLTVLAVATYVQAATSLASTASNLISAGMSGEKENDYPKLLTSTENKLLEALEQCSATQECHCALEKVEAFLVNKAKPGAYLIKKNNISLWEYVDIAFAECKDEAELSEGLNEGEVQEKRAASDIMRVIKKRTPRLKNIYNATLKVKPGLQGKVTLKFTINPDGKIISMSIVSSTTGDADFDKKIKADVSKWKFDRVKSGNTTVTIPFTFSED